MSAGRIIIKRIIQEFTENLPELIADLITSTCESIKCSSMTLDVSSENKVVIEFKDEKDQVIFAVRFEGISKEVFKKVLNIFKGD